jgi:integrase-like protein
MAAIIRVWLAERGGLRDDPLFPTRTGRRLSDDAVEARIAIHKTTAGQHCPSLAAKKLTPHVLRHTAAMALLREGIDVAVIALWLGHADIRSTDAYLHADMSIKERALARLTPLSAKPGRYRPPDSLLAFLENLRLSRTREHPTPPEPALTSTDTIASAKDRDNPGLGINPVTPTSG